MVSMEDRLKFASDYLCNILKLVAPKDSGNLSVNAIRIVYVNANEWNIVIGGELAPYALFTNEKWISPKWNGKQNPNEGWIQRGIAMAAPMINSMLSGGIDREEANKLIDNNRDNFKEQIIKLGDRF